MDLMMFGLKLVTITVVVVLDCCLQFRETVLHANDNKNGSINPIYFFRDTTTKVL